MNSDRSIIILLFFLICNSCIRLPVKTPDPESIVLYPSPPAQPRIQYLTSFSASSDFEEQQSAFNKYVFGAREEKPILKPYGVFVSGKNVYICDTGLGGIEILNLEENRFEYFVPRGLGQLQLPLNCCVDPRGYLFVADGNRKQVVIYNDQLQYVDAITLENTVKPTDVYADSNRIWIAAIDDHSMHVYENGTFSFLEKYRKDDPEVDGYLFQPANIAVDGTSILISDLGACKITRYSLEGDYLSSFGQPGRNFGQFTRPKGLAVDREGNIYVVDAAFENVQIFNPEGKLLMFFGGTYTAPGGMWLPADVCIDYENIAYFSEYVDRRFSLKYLIYVTNQYGPDKVSVYGFIEAANE